MASLRSQLSSCRNREGQKEGIELHKTVADTWFERLYFSSLGWPFDVSVYIRIVLCHALEYSSSSSFSSSYSHFFDTSFCSRFLSQMNDSIFI